MKGVSILLGQRGGKPAAARLVDGRLDDLLLSPRDDRAMPGAIFRAKMERSLGSQGGAILKLGGGLKGYLRRAGDRQPGERFLVQVTGHAEPGKALPVNDRPLFKSRYAIVTPGAPGANISRSIKAAEARARLRALLDDRAPAGGEAFGLILRSAAEHAGEADVAEDLAAMQDLAARITGDPGRDPELLLDGPDPHALAWRDWDSPDELAEGARIFAERGVDEMIDRLLQPRADLPGPGGYWMAIDPVTALTAVDVNTGNDGSPAAGAKANIAMIRSLPAELRCRGIGGLVVIDPAPQAKKARKGFEDAMRAAFRADPVETVLAGWSPSGLFELQRKRERLPIAEAAT